MAKLKLTHTEIPYAIPPRVLLPGPLPKGCSSAANPKATSFVDLPGEIRNQIYALTLLYPDLLVVDSAHHRFRISQRAGDKNGETDIAFPHHQGYQGRSS
jgi:hypothetical protein